MIFGAVSITFHGTTLKVHSIRSPPQIMLSVVFPAPPFPQACRNGDVETDESGTWTASVEINIEKSSENLDSHMAHSVPVNVPSRLSGHFADSRDSDSDSLQSHDGYSSLPTARLTPEMGGAGLPRSSSYNSLQRRILRNKATSIELGLPKSSETPNYSQIPGQKRSKLGLSIVISLNEEENKPEYRNFVNFLFTHISLVEGHLMTLKETVIQAYLQRKSFVHIMFEGSKKFQQSLSDLYTAPRLHNPEWLTIISSPHHRHLSYSFLSKFTETLKQYDKKETNFFVSTLLSAVLTHHLSWVPSVIPTDSKIQLTQSTHKHTPYWVDLLAKSRPYNPLWVQLSDLYGALGVPLKLSRTVVKGERRDVILKFLRILSYFIRCSDICQQLYERTDNFQEQEVPNSRLPQQEPAFIKQLSKCDSHTSLKGDTSPTTPPEPSHPLPPLSVSHTNSPVSERTFSEHIPNTSSAITDSQLKVPISTPESSKSHHTSLDMTHRDSAQETVEQDTSSCVEKREDCCTSSCVTTREDSCTSNCVTTHEDSCTSSCVKKCADFCTCRKCKTKGAKECESIEEGYHSMEEPHTPCRVALGEMMKRLESWCPEGCQGMPLPGLLQVGEASPTFPYPSFGWSLMAGVSDHYRSDFCLQGVCGLLSTEEISRDLQESVKIHVLGEAASESVCLIADTDKWSVQLMSSHSGDSSTTVTMSALVSSICDAIMSMVDLHIPPESCLIYLEDRLQELYTQSQSLADFVRGCRGPLTPSRIAQALSVDVSDVPLLLSVASTHSPYLPVYG